MVNWAYIAGFFDGEGSVGLTRNGDSGNSRFIISLPQSTRGGADVVLDRIREFLSAEGITIKSISTNKSPLRFGNYAMRNLQINKLESIQLFLRGVLPYLIVKKTLAQDCLRYMQMYPSLIPFRHEIKKSMGRWAKPLTEEKVMVAKIRRALRHTPYTELAKEFEVPTTTLRAACVGQNWKHLIPFPGDNSAYQQYYPSQQLTLIS